MTQSPELTELRNLYERSDSDDLLRIVHAPAGDYRPEAVQIAREILAVRDVSLDGESAQVVLVALEEERVLGNDMAALPLANWLKAVCFFFCGIPGIVIAAVQDSKGYTRRSREAWTWVGFGWLARFALVILGLLLG